MVCFELLDFWELLACGQAMSSWYCRSMHWFVAQGNTCTAVWCVLVVLPRCNQLCALPDATRAAAQPGCCVSQRNPQSGAASKPRVVQRTACLPRNHALSHTRIQAGATGRPGRCLAARAGRQPAAAPGTRLGASQGRPVGRSPPACAGRLGSERLLAWWAKGCGSCSKWWHNSSTRQLGHVTKGRHDNRVWVQCAPWQVVLASRCCSALHRRA